MRLNYTIRRYYFKIISLFVYKWWWATALFFIIVSVLGFLTIDKITLYAVNSHVESKLRKIERDFDRLSYEWFYNLDIEDKDYIWKTYTYHEKATLYPAALLLYKDSTCVYWSHSVLKPDSVIFGYGEGIKIHHEDGTVFLSDIKKRGNRTAVMLFILSSENIEHDHIYRRDMKSCIVDYDTFSVNLDGLGDNVVHNNSNVSLFSMKYTNDTLPYYFFDLLFTAGVLMLIFGGFTYYFRRFKPRNVIGPIIILVLISVAARVSFYLLNIIPNRGPIFDPLARLNIDVSSNSGVNFTIGDMFINAIELFVFVNFILYIKAPIKRWFQKLEGRAKRDITCVVYVLFTSAIICHLLYLSMLVVGSIKFDITYLSFYKIGIADFISYSILAITLATIYTINIFEKRILSARQYLIVEVSRFVTVLAVLLLFYEQYNNFIIYIIIFSALFLIFNVLYINSKNRGDAYKVCNIFVAILVTIFLSHQSRVSREQEVLKVADIAFNSSLNGSTIYAFAMLPESHKKIIGSNTSYVKIKNNVIIESVGKFVYNNNFNYIENDKFTVIGDYINYKKSKDGVTIIISYPKDKMMMSLSFFVFVFIFIQMCMIILMGVWFFFPEINILHKSIYGKLRLAVTLLCIGAAVSVYMFVDDYLRKSQTEAESVRLVAKIKSLSDEMSYEFNRKDHSLVDINKYFKVAQKRYNLDLNLYDKKGKLLCTSDSLALDKGLVSLYLNPRYYAAFLNKDVFYTNDEKQIFNNSYKTTISVFEAYNNESTFLQVYNLGTADAGAVDSLKIDIINIFIITFVIIFALLILFYRYTMRPLILLKESLIRMKYYRRIDSTMYKWGTEVDGLIDLYNNAIDELETTLVKLAEAGRIEALKVLTRQIAHELRNPLTPIKLKAQILLRRKQNGDPNWDENIEESLNIIIGQIDILANTINQLSAMATASTSTVDKIYIDQLMKDVVAFYKGYPNIEISYENSTQNENIAIVMSRDNLWSVLTNIVVNAIAAIGNTNGGKIEIKLSLKDNLVVISVKDNGGGISEDIKNKIFAPNFTTKKSGSGIGLTIASGFVKNVGGQLYFETVAGVGTTFYIEVPYIIINESMTPH